VSLGLILLIVLILMLVGAVPRWSHSRSWGYGPSGPTHNPLMPGSTPREAHQ